MRMTPDQLRDLRTRSGLTLQRAADLAGVALRTMQQYEAGDRAMPVSASALLCVSCILLGAPAGLLGPWLPAETARGLAGLEARAMRIHGQCEAR